MKAKSKFKVTVGPTLKPMGKNASSCDPLNQIYSFHVSQPWTSS